VGDVARVVSRWLEMAPGVHFLVGSRKRLGIKGEVAYELSPLPEPDRDNARNADAVRLFSLRARRASSSFQVSDPAVIADLVAGLEGNPLAIEVAAGMMHAWSPSDLRLALRGKTGPAVHRVLEAAWEQLDDEERAVLSRCAVFRGGFDRAGADAVVDDETIDAAAVLGRLRQRGLVSSVADADAPEILRYVLGPWVRRVAFAKVPKADVAALWTRFAGWLLETTEAWPARCWGREGPEVVARIGVEWLNLVGVIEGGIDETQATAETLNHAMRALVVLAPVFQTRGPAEIHMSLLDAVLKRCDTLLGADPLLQVQVLAARANAWRRAGQYEASRADLLRGGQIADRWADRYGQALCANTSGLLLWDTGSPEVALEEVQRASALFGQLKHPLRLGIATGTLGVIQMELGDFSKAESNLTEAVAIFREIDGRHFEGMYLGNLGLLHRRLERDEVSRSLYERARQIHRDTGDVRLQAMMAMNIGALDFRQGDTTIALELYENAQSLALEVGDRRTEAACVASLGVLKLDAGEPDRARHLLVRAMAINKDIGHSRGQTNDLGHLGLLHHLSGELAKAADYYRRAVRMAVQTGGRRQELTFLAFLGALEAESGNLDDAVAVFEAAEKKAGASAEADLTSTVEILSQSLVLLQASVRGGGERLASAALIAARLDQRERALGSRRGFQRFAIGVVRRGLEGRSS